MLKHKRVARVRPRHRPRRLLAEPLERREMLDAGLQVIHNSPYAAAAEVDVYVNDVLLLDDFAYQAATPFVTVPSGVDLKVDVTAANAPDNSSPVFTTTANLLADTSYVAIAAGDPLLPLGLAPALGGIGAKNRFAETIAGL